MKLKQYYPFIIPTISLLLVLFLAFRWYNTRTQRDVADITQVEIEDLTQEELQIVQGTQDVSTVELESEPQEPAVGQVRFKSEGDRVLLTVSADLPELENSYYQVWLSAQDLQPQPAFRLERSKAGYLGSASISKDQLPLEVIVTDQTGVTDSVMGKQLLRGMIELDEVDEVDEIEEVEVENN